MTKSYFSFDGTKYIVEKNDKTWHVRNVETGKLATSKDFDKKGFYSAMLSAKSELTAISGDEFVRQTPGEDSVPTMKLATKKDIVGSK